MQHWLNEFKCHPNSTGFIAGNSEYIGLMQWNSLYYRPITKCLFSRPSCVTTRIGYSHDDQLYIIPPVVSTCYLYLWLYPTQTPLFKSGPDSLSAIWTCEQIVAKIVRSLAAPNPRTQLYAPSAIRQLISRLTFWYIHTFMFARWRYRIVWPWWE